MASMALAAEIEAGAQKLNAYLPLIKDKNIALVVNHASVVKDEHLVDLLSENNISIKMIFAPEHGFRGAADAGEHLKNGVDVKSGLPIVSLYGSHNKPTSDDLKGIDTLLFDIQDVGVRFYTYLSTLHYVMEAAAENNLSVIVLDRPNPNAYRIDGPVLKKGYRSFVGLHPVPVLYGMTIGEYAQMINGEGWLKGGIKAKLTVIPLHNYRHSDFYHLPIKPSPNLPNDLSIALYPSLAFFEGSVFSAGRGTPKQFQLYGAPDYAKRDFSFVPEPREGAKYPKHQGKVCYGADLSGTSLDAARASKKIELSYLFDAYRNYPDKERFFLKNNFFDRLAGSDALRKQIIAGKSEKTIRAGWEEDLKRFRAVRGKYLLYP
ncbi:DUF1343 domain-containing protein [Sulfurimonas sp. HSL3-7]|uniref:exo-beta-N-acetylmuramidase NamZ family protein n=1 Tax=Sulfonitrofixus jiaomeiensis TaxID=3131938 RepID=UPI0031FA2078